MPNPGTDPAKWRVTRFVTARLKRPTASDSGMPPSCLPSEQRSNGSLRSSLQGQPATWPERTPKAPPGCGPADRRSGLVLLPAPEMNPRARAAGSTRVSGPLQGGVHDEASVGGCGGGGGDIVLAFVFGGGGNETARAGGE